MKTLTVDEMRKVDGGATAHYWCLDCDSWNETFGGTTNYSLALFHQIFAGHRIQTVYVND